MVCGCYRFFREFNLAVCNMIVDSILEFLNNSLLAFVSVLPVTPAPPEWLADSMRWVGLFSALLPVQQFMNFLPLFTAIAGVFITWRLIRLILPGG
jgi:hypothetical protein